MFVVEVLYFISGDFVFVEVLCLLWRFCILLVEVLCFCEGFVFVEFMLYLRRFCVCCGVFEFVCGGFVFVEFVFDLCWLCVFVEVFSEFVEVFCICGGFCICGRSVRICRGFVFY